jgi:hypothetical protein
MIIHQFLAIKDISLLFESGFASSRLIFSRHLLSDIIFRYLPIRYFLSGISEKRYNLKNRKNWMYMQSGFTAWRLSE